MSIGQWKAKSEGSTWSIYETDGPLVVASGIWEYDHAMIIKSATEAVEQNKKLLGLLERAHDGIENIITTHPEVSSPADYEFLGELKEALEHV